MSREYWTNEVTCPACGAKGTVDVSENDYPFMRDRDRRVDGASEGFTAFVSADGRTIQTTCVKCGVGAG